MTVSSLPLAPHAFVEKWRTVDLAERSVVHSHFHDLCRLLEEPDPVTSDPKGEWYTFEKGVSKTTGAKGWADVWKRGHFGWEYKGRGKDLDRAFAQLQQYAPALENPPLLIVCDTERFRIHTNWTALVPEVHEFRTEDLVDAGVRSKLKWAFAEPERLKPAKSRHALTEEAAATFAGLAKRLRERGHESEQVAHFVNRLVFCMFAEDVDLLPNRMFQRMLEHCQREPDAFEAHAAMLFGAMQRGGPVGFERVEWFNGGLFDDDRALLLDRTDLDEVLAAARLDWSAVDPAILGTLFERGLDPDKRSQLGAHYTDRDKIMLILNPVVVEPLSREWEATKAEIETALAAEKAAKSKSTATRHHNGARELQTAFLERLRTFRVLDPACGSGNFLNIALTELKNLEHRVNLDCETLGLGRGFPTVGPECVLGIELNPYAAELARVSVWIAEIQWMRRNGFDASRNPILKPLETIECRDAILAPDGARADWPDADAVVGNPPFLGDKKMIGELGEDYVERLRVAWKGTVRGGADLVLYWFAKAGEMVSQGRLHRLGFVSTNSIRGGANRDTLRTAIGEGRIFDAWDDEEWTVEGAAVRVSLVCIDGGGDSTVTFDGRSVREIFNDLTARVDGTTSVDLTQSRKLVENSEVCFEGMKKYGPLEINGVLARQLLSSPTNVNGRQNCDVIRPWIAGRDVSRRSLDRWVIDFGLDISSEDAALYEEPFAYLDRVVREVREKDRNQKTAERWWLFERPRPLLRERLSGVGCYIATVVVSKYRFFVWLHSSCYPSNLLDAIPRDDDTTFGILHSRFHELWSLRMGTSLEDRPRYTPSTTFETFAFPAGLTPDIPAADYSQDPRAQAIAAAAARLNELREAWLNPPDLVVRVPEVVEGYPDRILPKDDEAAKVLKKRTLTNLYNARPAWLDHAHRALDETVADAYGWGDDFRSGTLTEDEILARLFALNQERAASQGGKK
ncbi:MAG: DNA methyltransferase [Pseudomonadota bacterium]